MSAASDAELVGEALAGSGSAFREIVRRYERRVFALIVRMVGEAAQAEDLAQDAFVRAFTRLDTYDPARRFSSWLFKIAHNTTIDYLRRARIDTVPLDASESAAADRVAGSAPLQNELLERADLARALDEAIARLRPAYREAVLLRYEAELEQDEIAEVMGIPSGTVKTYLHRARKELAERLASKGWGRETRPPDVS